LNSYTLTNATNGVNISASAVTTNLNYDAGRMGNIVAPRVIFYLTNTLTQGATGTVRTISLPLITATEGASGLSGDFGQYVLSPGMNSPTKMNGVITLSHN
jgi:hypothetical protein